MDELQIQKENELIEAEYQALLGDYLASNHRQKVEIIETCFMIVLIYQRNLKKHQSMKKKKEYKIPHVEFVEIITNTIYTSFHPSVDTFENGPEIIHRD